MKHLAILLAAVLAITSCAQNPATGRQNFTLIGEQREYTIGQETAEQAIKEMGLYNEKPALTAYIENIAAHMWNTTERRGQPLNLIILDDDTFNAWATPGYINFYRGILPYFQSETHLAEVMGHEMGHITARHTAQSLTRGTIASLLLTAGSIYIGTQVDDNATAQIAYTLGGLGAGITLSAYSRGQELEADRLALRYMQAGGYDAREAYASNRAMELYEAYSNQRYAALNDGNFPASGALNNLMKSHPNTPDRSAQVEQLVGRPDGTVKLPAGVQPATPASDPFGQKRYLNMIDGLAVGPKAQFGNAGRNVVYFPKQRFIWRLPDSSAGGFVLELAAKDADEFRWLAANPQAGVKAALEFIPMKDGLAPAQTLMQKYGELKAGNWQNLTVGQGATAQTAATASITSSGKLIRVVGVPIPTKNLLAVIRYQIPQGQAGADAAILGASGASQVLSEARAKLLQPMRIKARTAAAGDNVATLSAQLPAGNVGNLNELWFRALNGLHAGEDLSPGQMYKTVVDPNR